MTGVRERPLEDVEEAREFLRELAAWVRENLMQSRERLGAPLAEPPERITPEEI